MPFKSISYEGVGEALKKKDEGLPDLISTPNGLAILEIQGELCLPSEVSESRDEEEEIDKFILTPNQTDAVKFGRLEYEGNKVTLYIGKSQRLVGSIEKLATPLGILKFPSSDTSDQDIQVIDIIKHKMLFKLRPLPIM